MMYQPTIKWRALVLHSFRRILLFATLFVLIAPALFAADPEIFPLSQVKPGMRGEALTIFAGDEIEKFDLVVIGVMPNFLGPKESIILVQLVGPKVEHTGVVAGMSGSPVYIEGKLAGALSLKLGTFTKEPLAGVTPIENILSLPTGQQGVILAEAPQGAAGVKNVSTMQQFEMPPVWTSRSSVLGGSFLKPIDSPLVFSGFNAVAVRQFAGAFAAYGMEASQGGTADARPDDRDIKPGDMVSAVLLEGDLSLNASCTVTAIVDGRVYVCGHAHGARACADDAQFGPGLDENSERGRHNRIVRPRPRYGRHGTSGRGAEYDPHRYDGSDSGRRQASCVPHDVQSKNYADSHGHRRPEWSRAEQRLRRRHHAAADRRN
jgi:hypothetical protein